MGVQSSLFSLGLELEASQRSLRQSQRQGDDLMRFRDRLNADLQEVLQHREVTEKNNQVSEIQPPNQNKSSRVEWRGMSNLLSLCAAGPPLCPPESSLGASGQRSSSEGERCRETRCSAGERQEHHAARTLCAGERAAVTGSRCNPTHIQCRRYAVDPI